MSDEDTSRSSVRGAPPGRSEFPPFEALRAFDAVARLGGVRKGAQALLRDHAVVSRHLRTLEAWTGATLFERTPGGMVLTAEGREFHEKTSHAIDAIAKAAIDLLKRKEENCVHVWCMPAFALHWMMGHLESFQKTNTELEMELRSTHETPDFERQEADVVIRLAPVSGDPAPQPGFLKSIEIARLPTIPVASPAYLSSHQPISSPQDLVDHELLHEEDVDVWQSWFAACGHDENLNLGGPRLWHGHMTMAAARRGRGVALSNLLVAGEDLASGRLVDVGADNPTFQPVTLWGYTFVARADRWNARPIARFRDWLLETVGQELPAGRLRW